MLQQHAHCTFKKKRRRRKREKPLVYSLSRYNSLRTGRSLGFSKTFPSNLTGVCVLTFFLSLSLFFFVQISGLAKLMSVFPKGCDVPGEPEGGWETVRSFVSFADDSGPDHGL